jgi:undecaprenyl-phosphate 4-deoxy-4-formamido-L-arabinose transferase
VSIVVPVYQGEKTLEALVAEIEPLTREARSPKGRGIRVAEAILVYDGAVDGSRAVMEALAELHPFLSLVWLSRNYGQHPATLAGMSGTSGEWVVTLDEDGQQDPADIGRMLDCALDEGVSLVYARPLNPPPHGVVRNLLGSLVKCICRWILNNRRVTDFNSFRLVRGDIARSIAAYCGQGVYLDVALSWVIGACATCPVTLRPERGRASGYTLRKLASHSWRLILTSGTRPLRIISALGFLSILAGAYLSGAALYGKFTHQIPVQGYTSLLIVICIFSGIILFSLGVIAEYLGLALTMAMGKPLYLIVSKPGSPGKGRA